MKAFLELLYLFRVFFGIGLMTFGGGLTMLPILERELIRKRHWMTGEQMVDWFAIGQCTPGIIAVNVATFIGYYRRGIIGAVCATAGIVTPSVIIITLLAGLIESTSDITWVSRAMTGINVGVAALLVNAAWNFARKTLIDRLTIGIALLSFVAMAFFDAPAVLIIFCAGTTGVIARKVQRNRS